MTDVESVFLSALSSGVNGFPVDKDPELSADQWEEVLSLAIQHSILPLVCNEVYQLKSFRALENSVIRSISDKSYGQSDSEKSLRKFYQEKSVGQTIRQIEQEKDFLNFLMCAQHCGLDPVVIKGLVVRNIYPMSYLRLSVDEDILIPPEQAEAFHQVILGYGFTADEPEINVSEADELSYHKPGSPSYIELHKHPFSKDSDVLEDFNELFTGAMGRTIHVQIEDVSVRTLAPTDHLLYLILHAFKHFVHSGIGIRAVCDIGLFAERYFEEISAAEYTANVSSTDHSDGTDGFSTSQNVGNSDSAGSSDNANRFISGWDHIRTCLEQVHAFDFTRAIFNIVKQYLLPDAKFFDCINGNINGNLNENSRSFFSENGSDSDNSEPFSDWHIDEIDVEPLLEDILASGVHGNSSLQRLHSSNITLKAIAQERKARSSQSIRKTASSKSGEATSGITADHAAESASKRMTKSPGLIGTAFHSVFLPLKSMSGRYPYLKKAPFLLPFAWTQRICRYLKERITAADRIFSASNSVSSISGRASSVSYRASYGSDRSFSVSGSVSSASDKQRKHSESKKTSATAESLRLGRSRVELLRKYGIINHN